MLVFKAIVEDKFNEGLAFVLGISQRKHKRNQRFIKRSQ